MKVSRLQCCKSNSNFHPEYRFHIEQTHINQLQKGRKILAFNEKISEKNEIIVSTTSTSSLLPTHAHNMVDLQDKPIMLLHITIIETPFLSFALCLQPTWLLA